MRPNGAQDMLSVDVIYAWVASISCFFFYLGLYCYLDAIIPNTYGISRHPCFCFKSSKKQESASTDILQQNDTVVQFCDLSKTFGNHVAVDKLSLTMNKGEVLALLGHNGAGKTTAINMMTGMIAPSSGDVIVNGFSLRENVNNVRQSLGLC
jgi:ATP-binding cassette, subfamily A (ABC1), member 3